ncbi:MAG TPA: ferric reductase-like transmembrane domain-containing protein [Gaiellaceae bacterium]|nr:ferric reductase-like transmembrane domain-containing protein [Gaiellaceae bacterium]
MSHALWYATRGTGTAALVLLTVVVAVGIAGTLRLRSERWPRFLVFGLHRNLTLLTLCVLVGHIATTVLDSYTPIGLAAAFVPFVSSYRPLWLGLGAVALDLLLALTVTSLLRARIGQRTWRGLHWLAYAAWPVALAHGLGTGSDARFGWMQLLSVACVLAVLAALAARLSASAAPPARRGLAAAAALAAVVGGFAWYSGGPGAPGWARRAGTPSALLPAVRPAAAAAPAAARTQPVSDVPSVPFSAHLAGRLTTAVEGNDLVRIDIRGRTSGGAAALLWIRLEGRPIDDGGVSMTASGVHFGTAAAPNLYTGSIRALSGSELTVGLRDAQGRRIELDVLLNIDQATSTVDGLVRALPAAGDSQ